ncbi:MAG: hypothetical protein NZ845_01235 [Thermodesulfovibrio sp.]|nr:hypothetical protein [Thermodesulfovibrio sp.]
MRFLIFIIFLILLPIYGFSKESSYVFIVDGSKNPLLGYKVVETDRDDIFIGKIEILKKWISIISSEMIVVKDGSFYPVVDSLILDKKREIVLLIVDLHKRKPIYFNPEEYRIFRDVKILMENKSFIIAKIKKLFPKEVKIAEFKLEELINTAYQFEKAGQTNKALQIYEEILKQKPKEEILEKVAMLYYKVGDYKKAKEAYLKLSINKERLEKIVGILIINKDFELAQRIIENIDLNSAYIHYLRGVVYYLNGQKDKAYREINTLSTLDKNLTQSLRDLLR